MFNKIIATATIRFIVTVAIVVYKGLTPVVYRMLTFIECYRFPLLFLLEWYLWAAILEKCVSWE